MSGAGAEARQSSHAARLGILLINSGTPEAPTAAALRRYHAEFLSDPRVVDWPRWLWLPLLHGVILRTRPAKVAEKYREIWTERGSPLLVIMQEIRSALEERLRGQVAGGVLVEVGMRYGQPSIAAGLRALRGQGAGELILAPLFPQFSRVTTASAYDAVDQELAGWSDPPAMRTVDPYFDHPAYIDALKHSLLEFWDEQGQPERLLLSYHGLPQRYADRGDPYGRQCSETSRLLREALGPLPMQVQTAYQSRFGPQPWLKPYTDELLRSLAAEGAASVDVLCPGFPADCLETLHEIGIEARRDFLEWGGGALRYVPALNARPLHIEALAEILAESVGGL